MARRRLSLPSINNSEAPNPHDTGFRTIGQALTADEPKPVSNVTGWFLDLLGR